MNYPRMLYKGEPIYSDSAQMKMALESKMIHTVIVTDEIQEQEKKQQGYVSLPDLMAKRPTLTLKKADVKA